MSNQYGDPKPGEFLPGITLPTALHAQLRKRVTEIGVASSAVNCLIAQARAESLVEALELLKAVETSVIERLYMLIDEQATQRLADFKAEPHR